MTLSLGKGSSDHKTKVEKSLQPWLVICLEMVSQHKILSLIRVWLVVRAYNCKMLLQNFMMVNQILNYNCVNRAGVRDKGLAHGRLSVNPEHY